MTAERPRARIEHILCPSDLSQKSQKALGFATRIAETLNARLTACHSIPATWFTADHSAKDIDEKAIKARIREQIASCQTSLSKLVWETFTFPKSHDAARDILDLAASTNVDLIVMKARPGVLSAFHFGSIVERVVTESKCPVLLFPSRFLDERDPVVAPLNFERVLFDYDFSEATHDLFLTANTLTQNYDAELHILSVLAPPTTSTTEVAPSRSSRTAIQTAVRGKLNDALKGEGRSLMDVPTAVEWGRHAEKVLDYAKAHEIGMICTALAPPHFYFEKFYRTYLGSLLRSTACPILVKQSV